MFGFLKNKLKEAVGKFTKTAKEEAQEEEVKDEKLIADAKEEEKKTVKSIPKKKPVAKKEEPKKVEKPKAQAQKKEVGKKPISAPIKKTEAPEKKAETPLPKATEQKEKKTGFFSRIFGKKEELPKAESSTSETEAPKAPEQEISKVTIIEEPIGQAEPETILEEESEESEEEPEEPITPEKTEEETGFISKLKTAFTKKTLSEEKFEELFWELEVAMLENNVAVEVIEKIKDDLKSELTSGKVSRMGLEDMIASRLRQSVEELFDVETFDLIERIRSSPKPYKICIIGVNGSGKTTTLAKIIKKLQNSDLSVVVAASDTFRAAAIDQLREHTEKLGVNLISQGYGADPAAVAFDAIKHAQAKEIDVVLIDTAGRLHSNTNLMAELEKVVRVAKPDLKIFVGEAITGNDCVEQAKVFNELVGIDAIILSKADIDEKGGAAISVSFVTGKPILFLGTGQTYEDLEPFDREKIIESVGL